MIGQQLAGRYEMIDRVGGGGMALVYKAHDAVLNRKVAIKILRQQFVHDEDFIRRFRREAQSAASLSHPNVVNIYDVGQDGDIYYIVMEYIEGQNLNERIKAKAPLPIEEAVDIAAQICDALAHAHHNQIIHRDIKPHNILIGKNNRIKVTDFGIARAATSSDITQTGSVIGSVHYFSPEHAKGVSQGAKSDLYSLGIVLYQMVTNRLPFLGESPISIALKHLQEHVEDPRSIYPDIPQSVENIILKALRKKPEERYQSAEEMLQDLETCLHPERLHEPRITFHETYDDEETRIMPAIKRSSGDSYEEADSNINAEQERPRDFVVPGVEADGSEKSKKWKKPTIITLIVLLLFVAGIFTAKAFIDRMKVPEVLVPDLSGMTLDEASLALSNINLSLRLPADYESHDEVEEGKIIGQDRVDMHVKEGSEIRVTVSSGVRLVTMLDLTDKTWESARNDLLRIGFEAEQILRETEYSEKPVGAVIQQQPLADAEVDPRNTTVTLTLSDGPEMIEMPELVTLSQEAAEARIERAGLVLAEDGIRKEASFDTPDGHVFRQFPAEPGEEIKRGSEVVIYVSSGYPEDAIDYEQILIIDPSEDGKDSTVRIMLRDAAGDTREWDVREISSQTAFPIRVIVTPAQDAYINYYVDGQLSDSIRITYEQAAGLTTEDPDEEPSEEPDNEGPNETDTEEQPASGSEMPGEEAGDTLADEEPDDQIEEEHNDSQVEGEEGSG